MGSVDSGRLCADCEHMSECHKDETLDRDVWHASKDCNRWKPRESSARPAREELLGKIRAHLGPDIDAAEAILAELEPYL